MMDESNSTTQANLEPVDEIASLLMGDEEETQETDTETTDTPDPEDIAEDTSDESEESIESEEEVEESEDEEIDYQTELSQALGVDKSQLIVDDDGNLSINVKVDGEVSKLSMSDVIKGFQTNKSNTHKSQALAEERKAFEAHMQEQQNLYKAKLEENMALANALEQDLVGDYNAENWDDLRQYSPEEYAVKRLDYGTKYQKLARLKEQLQQDTLRVQQQAFEERQKKMQTYLKGEREKMLNLNPTWTDEATFKKDMGSIRDFLSNTYGFTDENFRNVTDSRLIEMAKDAKAYREGKQVTKKKVTKVPRIQKSKGKVRDKSKLSRLDKLTKAAKRAKGDTKRSLQAEAVAEMLLNGE